MDRVEERLLDELRLLSQSGSLAQRESAWGMYLRIANGGAASTSGIGAETMICLFELISRDDNSSRVLARISEALCHIKNHRQLTDSEIASVQRICDDIEAHRIPHSRSPVFPPREQSLQPRDSHKPKAPKHTVANHPLYQSRPAIQQQACEMPADVNTLRQTLEMRPVLTDPAAVWRAYRDIVDHGSDELIAQLTKQDMTRLVAYCGSMGAIAGVHCLTRIEIDAIAKPDLFPSPHAVLITAYAKLGSLGNSRRCYQDAIECRYRDLAPVEWSMCIALFKSSRQKEGRAIFDRLVDAGAATSQMYSILLTEYTIMHNTKAAFALFGDMCKLNIKPEYRAFCALATACSMSRDPGNRNIMQLDEVIAGMKSWGYTPDTQFFVSILKGYHRSNQHGLFSGLLARLKVHQLDIDIDMYSVMLANAAACKQTDVAISLANIVTEEPHNIPKVVQALCSTRLASKVPGIIELKRLPENNELANARLELEIHSPKSSSDPQRLLDYIDRAMLQRGFTPSFRLFRDVIRHLWLYGGRGLAISVYERLSSAGVPKSIGTLATALQLYAGSNVPHAALGVFDELAEHLEGSDLGSVSLHAPTLDKLMRLLIERRGIDPTQDALDMLLRLPIDKSTLPYGPLIEYYVNHKHTKRSRSIISHVVQYNVPLMPRAINIYCRDLAQESTATDFANFLRYLSRTRSLDKVADDVFGSFFVICAAQNKVFDFEWAARALAAMHGRETVWRLIVDLLAKQSTRSLALLVRSALKTKESAARMALSLLTSTRKSPWCAVVADSVLLALKDVDVSPSRQTYNLAISALTRSWTAHSSLPDPKTKSATPQGLLVESLSRNIYNAIQARIAPSLITRSLLVLSLAQELEYQGLSASQATYAMLLQACINAKRYDHAEALLSEMLDRGVAHSSITAYLWMRVRLDQSDVRGALAIFSAIGDEARCEALATKDPRFQGLPKVKRGPKHFAALIHFYASKANYKDALALMRVMHKLGMKADAWLYATILQRLAEADNRELFVQAMKQMAEAQVDADGQAMDVIKAYTAQKHKASPDEQSQC
ncbi:hypothetical protein GGI12_000854 [Dipsacomyces acuminosporus]|nr:hypothetical protein GGI12_000854 [Dipsacomyces acuminosporus]